MNWLKKAASNTLVAVTPGAVEIISGAEARSADVKPGDIFNILSEEKNWYVGTLSLSGGSQFVHDPNLSGRRDLDTTSPVDAKGVKFIVRKENINSEEPSDFFASWKFKEGLEEESSTGGFDQNGVVPGFMPGTDTK